MGAPAPWTACSRSLRVSLVSPVASATCAPREPLRPPTAPPSNPNPQTTLKTSTTTPTPSDLTTQSPVIRVKKRLTIPAGVKSYEVSLESQTASVVAEEGLDYATVLRTIAKTGKKVNKGVADGVEQSVEVSA